MEAFEKVVKNDRVLLGELDPLQAAHPSPYGELTLSMDSLSDNNDLIFILVSLVGLLIQ